MPEFTKAALRRSGARMAGSLEPPLVDPPQQPAHGLARIDHPGGAGHPGAHRAGVQDHRGDASRLEIVRQRNAGGVQRALLIVL